MKSTGLKPISNVAASEDMVDEALWKECRSALPGVMPPKSRLPYLCSIIDRKIKVYLVDGNRVKVEHDMDFVEGGNGEEDPGLCKKDEIYLDADHDIKDLAFVLYHEAHERRDMAKGMPYDKAHERANRGEKALRKRGMK